MKFPKNTLHSGHVRLGMASVAALGLLVALPFSAQAAAQPSVGLGTAKSFSVLAGSQVTNTGPSVISGDLGVSPGLVPPLVTGFPPGLVHGTQHKADTVAAKAQQALTAAYLDAAGRKPFTKVPVELAGKTLMPGVYAGGVLRITGTLTLDAGGDPNAVFIFKAASSLITGSGSQVKLINGASSCNVFWQVTSSATLGSGSTFVGTVMALTSITLATGATVDGRVLARNALVSLQRNTITSSPCVVGATVPVPQVPQVPAGPVSTGDGSTSGGTGDAPYLLLTAALVLAGVGGTAVFVARRRRQA